MLAIGLWCTEALPAGVTSLVLIVALVLSGAVPGFREALSGFADPVAYFLIGVLTIGLAVSRSGLAERVALFFLRRSRGSARSLYLQLLLAFPLLTFILPSATTRTGILVHVYEQALELAQVPRRAPLAQAVMMALNSINRLASTVLLTGGITPVVSAALIGGIYWSQWLLLMSVPYIVLLALGSLLIYWLYRHGFEIAAAVAPSGAARPLSGKEWRTVAITVGASALWMTDAVHHWHPVVPALLAWIFLLMPRIGVLTWSEFERDIGWTNFFVLASSLSLARALVEQRRQRLDRRAHRARPCRSSAAIRILVIAVLLVASVPVRLLIPNITRLSRDYDTDRDVDWRGDRRQPDDLRARGDDRRGRGAVLPGAERVVSRRLRARLPHRAGDLPLRRVDDADRFRRGAGGSAAVLERDRGAVGDRGGADNAAQIVRRL